MTNAEKTTVKALIRAAENVWKAFRSYGPVDDGSTEGDALDRAFSRLIEAKHEAKEVIKE